MKTKTLSMVRRPKVVGLTGGVAAGKSTLAEGLRRCGAGYYSVDSAAHALYRPGTRVWRSILGIFGEDIAGPDGSIDRVKLGKKARSSAASLARLEKAVHPALSREAQAAVRRLRRKYELTVVEAGPLLFKLGLDRFSDLVVWLDCPRKVRLARLKSGKGLSFKEAVGWIRSYRNSEISLKRDFSRARNRIKLESGTGRKWMERAVRIIAARALSGGGRDARSG